MKIYNRELSEIQDLEMQNRIENILKKQIDFLVLNYGISKEMLESKLKGLSIVEYSKQNDKTYLKRINGKIEEFSIGNKIAAFYGQKGQEYSEDKCLLDNAVFIDASYSDSAFEHTFSHELFHYLSSDTEILFNEENEAFYKSGLSLGKYDRDDNLLDENSRGLNEGITELLAIKLTGTHGEEYNIPVKIADILISDNNQSLLQAYFSDNKTAIQCFYDEFDKRQSSISSQKLQLLPATSSYFPLDIKILKGCLEYTLSFCENMEQLTAERKRLLPIFKDMRNDLNIEYSEENFDIKELFDIVLSEKRNNIQSKSTQELGKETLDIQKDTAYIDDTQHEIDREQMIIENKGKNTQEL